MERNLMKKYLIQIRNILLFIDLSYLLKEE